MLVGSRTWFPVDTIRAHILVIAKEGKDPLLCQNYRPISLLNIDLKLFFKIFATRLMIYITDIVYVN